MSRSIRKMKPDGERRFSSRVHVRRNSEAAVDATGGLHALLDTSPPGPSHAVGRVDATTRGRAEQFVLPGLWFRPRARLIWPEHARQI